MLTFAIRHAFLTLTVALGLAVAGFWAWKTIPVDAIPDLSDTQVIVWAEWPGQTPDDLDRQITSEEERTGVRNEAHFAYSTFARAAAQRRDNLRASVADHREKREHAVAVRDEAVAELETAATAEERTGERPRRVDHDAGDARMS